MEINNSCCCCLLRPSDKHLKMPYTCFGKTEIYANMLKECFEIHLTSLSSDDMTGICEVCVGRLRDASAFKLQVQRSQAELQARLQGGLQVKEEEDAVKPEISDEEIGQEELIYVSEAVKTEILIDPLPIAKDEEFEDILGLENQASDVCKQETKFEVAVKEQSTELLYTTPESGIVEGTFEQDIKPKKGDINVHHTCNTCGEQFAQKSELNIHKRTHKKPKYSCELCKKQFKWQSLLKEHGHVHTGVKPYGCDICNKRFSNKSNLTKHKRLHTGERQFNCDICKAQFNQKQSLISHMGGHTGQKRFPCKYCPIKFLEHNRLRKHIKDYHNKDICYSCDKCKKVFRDRYTLVVHLNTHTKAKVYSCDLCEIKLSTKSSLRRHKLIHTQEKPYPCEMCNKQFRYKHCLNAHILTHTGDKPHCCEICGKRFAEKNTLKKHLEIHVEGVIYACQLCSKSYSTSDGLRQHRRTHTKNKALSKSVSKKQKYKETNID